MTRPPTHTDLLIQAHRALQERIPTARVATAAERERRERSLRTCHRYALSEEPRYRPPVDNGAYVPEMAARIEDDRNVTDGARRCARKLAEYTYRQNRESRAAEITVTYLMRALGRCRRTVQRYLRNLEREGYIRVSVLRGHRSRMCCGLVVQLLSPLFPRHHRERWPGKAAVPDATRKSQKDRLRDLRGQKVVRIPVQEWALRCMDGVYRSLMKTIPPLEVSPALAA
ncbi:MAG: hypothetical protein IT449_12450 [Phycisphaerales bacterium]|nr:hypothetical protein [Phycisphaerales bacterium]